MKNIENEMQWRLTGYLLLAFFSSLLTFSVFIVFQNRDMMIFQKVMDFHGDAPDQYRIIPYLVLKGLDRFIALFDVRYSSIKVAVIIFNFIFLATSYVLAWNSYSRLKSRTFDVSFLLFSLVYPISMFYGFRPVTSFYVFLICLIIFCLNRNDKGQFLFISLLSFIFCFSRTDLAIFMSIFLSIYFFESKKTKIIFLCIPIVVFLILKYLVFPDSEYYTSAVMLKYNLTSHIFILFLSPLTYLFLSTFCLWRKSFAGFFRFVFLHHRSLATLFGAYLGLVLGFGNITEFRLWMPFFPLVLFLLDQQADLLEA